MLDQIAILFRYLQFFAHLAHNQVGRAVFYQDHEALGELYPVYESAYDATVERMIGLGENPELFRIENAANSTFQEAGKQFADWKENAAYFQVLLQGEKKLCEIIEEYVKQFQFSQGTLNMLAQFADESEQRQYKIGQRLKN